MDTRTILHRAHVRIGYGDDRITPAHLAQAISPTYSYLRDLLDGRASISGADLQGKAREYSASYHAVRREAVAYLEAEDIGHVRRRPGSGELTLEDRCPPLHALLDRCAAGDCWEY